MEEAKKFFKRRNERENVPARYKSMNTVRILHDTLHTFQQFKYWQGVGHMKQWDEIEIPGAVTMESQILFSCRTKINS